MADEKLPQNDDSTDGLNFKEEAENLGSADDWFTPPTGTTQVLFNDNGTKDVREYDDGPTDVVVFAVEIDGEEKKWTVSKAQSDSSLYGQLVRVGAAWEGLEGETITLIRNGKGTDTQYTVQEAADL